MTSSVEYHLSELEVARDRNDPRRCMPDIAENEHDVLDIGCGIGQFFIAQGVGGHRRIGLDIDQQALAYGVKNFPDLNLLQARSEALPFADESFDLVVSRVCLPYTDIGRALDEIRRVLRPGGRVWLSLHPLERTWIELVQALRLRHAKDVVYRCYVAANGALLHCTGKVLPFAGTGRVESFQTRGGMRRLMQARNFASIETGNERHLVISARKPGASLPKS